MQIRLRVCVCVELNVVFDLCRNALKENWKTPANGSFKLNNSEPA